MTLHQPDIPALERQTFLETFKYKLIYVYTIDDKKHEGYLKVGDTDVVSTLVPDQLTPNCKTLNDAGRLTFAAAKMGAEVIPGLLASIRKATSERREYGKGKVAK